MKIHDYFDFKDFKVNLKGFSFVLTTSSSSYTLITKCPNVLKNEISSFICKNCSDSKSEILDDNNNVIGSEKVELETIGDMLFTACGCELCLFIVKDGCLGKYVDGYIDSLSNEELLCFDDEWDVITEESIEIHKKTKLKIKH